MNADLLLPEFSSRDDTEDPRRVETGYGAEETLSMAAMTMMRSFIRGLRIRLTS